ncbi:MAG: hypothetical protein G01um101419_377 [Parcubacteria group bacterium Gr01-1014_19]|nr:MAG: hypothetical protein G01um101419_377 [Parcubacteria group bacterium Gr01-1014_19]
MGKVVIGEKWMKWTLLEAGTRTGSKLLQKVIGLAAPTFAFNVVASFVVGLMQTLAGFLAVKKQGKSFFPNRQQVWGSIAFGTLATFSTIVPFTIFYLGGDIGVNTFIITLSIVPGAFIDRIFFGHKLTGRQWAGVGMAVIAGYSVLGWPTAQGFFSLPLWVWLSFAVMMANAVNQGITQKVKDVDPMVKNFWGGFTNVALSLGVLAFIGSLGALFDFSPQLRKLWLAAPLVGGIVIAMWSFNLLSYKGGASIALKKLVMNGTYLTAVMVLSVLIPYFKESMTWGKAIGIPLYFVAFALMDNGTWNYVSSWFCKETVKSGSDAPVKVPTKV